MSSYLDTYLSEVQGIATAILESKRPPNIGYIILPSGDELPLETLSYSIERETEPMLRVGNQVSVSGSFGINNRSLREIDFANDDLDMEIVVTKVPELGNPTIIRLEGVRVVSQSYNKLNDIVSNDFTAERLRMYSH